MTLLEIATLLVGAGSIVGNVFLTVMNYQKEKAIERLKKDLETTAFKEQTRFERLQGLRQDAIFELSGLIGAAVSTAGYFHQSGHCVGFDDRDRPLRLIGEDWGAAYRKLKEKGLLFEPALESAMYAVVNGIEKVQRELRPAFSTFTPGEHKSIGLGRAEAWKSAATVFRDEVLPSWTRVREEFQKILGVEIPPGGEAKADA